MLTSKQIAKGYELLSQWRVLSKIREGHQDEQIAAFELSHWFEDNADALLAAARECERRREVVEAAISCVEIQSRGNVDQKLLVKRAKAWKRLTLAVKKARLASWP